MTTLDLSHRLGEMRLLIPEPPAWKTVDVWRTSRGGTALIEGKTVLQLFKDRWTLSALNITNGWPDPITTLAIESIAGETPSFLQKQTNALYDWEDKEVPFELMSIEEAQAFAEEVCADREVECPTLKKTPENSRCSVSTIGRYGNVVSVNLLLHSKRDQIYRHHVLHELSHYFEYQKYRVTRHGIGFCNIYADLLSDYGMMKQPRHRMLRWGLTLEHR